MKKITEIFVFCQILQASKKKVGDRMPKIADFGHSC